MSRSSHIYTFRDAGPEDFAAVCRLVSSREEMFMVYPSGRYPFTVEQLEVLSQQRQALTVMLAEETLVGFANLYRLEEGRHAFIGNVVIDRSRRGRGLGKALVSHMLALAQVRYRLPEVRISVFNENTPALLLYTGLGFVPYAVDQRTGPQDRKVALIHMTKSLGESL